MCRDTGICQAPEGGIWAVWKEKNSPHDLGTHGHHQLAQPMLPGLNMSYLSSGGGHALRVPVLSPAEAGGKQGHWGFSPASD